MPAQEPTQPVESAWPVGGGESGARIRAFNWAATPLGPLAAWPQSLRTAVDLCLGLHFPTALLWGPDLTLIHNDAHLPILGARAEGALGRPAPAVLGDTWPALEPLVARALADDGAQAPALIDLEVAFDRGGAPRPGHLSASFSAVRDESGRPAGVVIAAIELSHLRRRVAEIDAFLMRFSEEVRGLADPEAIAGAACRLLAEALGVERAYWAEVDWETREYVIGAAFHRPGVPVIAGRFPIGAWEPFTSLHLNGRPVVVDDTRADPRIPPAMREAYAQIAVGADLATPVVADGLLRCTLAANQRLPRHWTPEEVALVQGIAGRCWAEVERARAEAALRASEEKYRSLFDAMAEGFALAEIVRDGAGRAIDIAYLELNEGFERQTGMPRDRLRGRRLTDVFPPEDVGRWLPVYARVVDTGEPAAVEDYIALLDRWYGVSVYPRGGDRLSMFFRDITARRRAEAALRASEERQAFLLALADALRPLADPIAIQVEATRVLGHHLGASRAMYSEVEADDAHFVVHRDYTDGVPSLAGRHLLDAFGPAFIRAHRAGLTLTLADVARDERVDGTRLAAYVTAGIGAFVGVPLIKGGRLVASLSVHFPGPHAWSPAEVALVEETAERTWAAVERARAEAALHASEARFRGFAEASADTLWIVDAATGMLAYLSPAFERMFGAPRESALARPGHWDDLVRPEDRAAFAPVLPRALAGQVALADYRIARPDGGGERWMRDTAFPIRDAAGAVRWAAGIVQDVTADRRTRDALTASEARQAFLVRLADALQPLADAAAIEGAACRLLGKHLGTDRAFYCEFRAAEGVTVVQRDYTRGGVPSLRGTYPIADFAWMMDLYGRGRPVAIDDVWRTEAIPEAYRAASAAAHIAWVVVPLIRGGALAGTFCVADMRPRAWTDAEVVLARETAERLWATIARARAEAALRQLNDDLEARVAARTAELRALSIRLLGVQEEVQRTLSRELHDQVGQLLTGQRLALARARPADDASAAALVEAETIAAELHDQVRAIITDLRPPTLDEFGLLPALLDHIARYTAQTGITVDLRHEQIDRRFPAAVETAAFRLVQEALTNVARYAGVDRAAVLVVDGSGWMTVQVRDAGRGFDPATTERTRAGLTGMHERAELLGGTLTIDSTPGEGTVVTAEFPIDGEEGAG